MVKLLFFFYTYHLYVLVLGRYYNLAYCLLWTPYCWYINEFGSGGIGIKLVQ